ncbi:MAG: 1-aminocyclopropane-1-carboxylate deaminase, partial [Campylobacter sp.]|nr:1-aminocyclopropane-1-carboxylate deaminase [Campylobacter sp.]
MEQICIDGFKFWLLRDDLLGVINGNKARKLHYYLNADLSKFKKIVSYGSSQSNAMYS